MRHKKSINPRFLEISYSEVLVCDHESTWHLGAVWCRPAALQQFQELAGWPPGWGGGEVIGIMIIIFVLIIIIILWPPSSLSSSFLQDHPIARPFQLFIISITSLQNSHWAAEKRESPGELLSKKSMKYCRFDAWYFK